MNGSKWIQTDIRLPALGNRAKWVRMDIHSMHEIKNITITPEILKLIAEIDEFKGRWKAIQVLAPERLTSLKRVATIESIGSSTRIEGAKLTDRQVEKLLSGMKSKSFASRDEQEVAGYADAMDMIFESFESITPTENHIKQLHGVLLKYSQKGPGPPGPLQEGAEPRRGFWSRRQEPGCCI
jgi:Fic family protein